MRTTVLKTRKSIRFTRKQNPSALHRKKVTKTRKNTNKVTKTRKKIIISKKKRFMIALMTAMLPYIKKKTESIQPDSDFNSRPTIQIYRYQNLIHAGAGPQDEIKKYRSFVESIQKIDPEDLKNDETLKEEVDILKKDIGCISMWDRMNNLLALLYGGLGKLYDNREKLYEKLTETFDQQESTEIIVRVYKSLFKNPERYDFDSTKIYLNKDSNMFTDAREVEELFRSLKDNQKKVPPQREHVTERKIKITRNPKRGDEIRDIKKVTSNGQTNS
jgi:viroplasmin and RNaseH domain-containing protein